MYDIHVSFKPKPALLTDPQLKLKLTNITDQQLPFWLDLSLEYKAGAILIREIRDARGIAILAKEEYKKPKVTESMALEAAVPELKKQQSLVQERYEEILQWDTVHVSSIFENPRVWVFFSRSPTLVGFGIIPGGVDVCVDKLTGQIVNPMDLAQADDDVLRAAGVTLI